MKINWNAQNSYVIIYKYETYLFVLVKLNNTYYIHNIQHIDDQIYFNVEF